MSRLEELEKAVDDAREEIQKAWDAWATWDAATYAAADAAWVAHGDAVWAAYVDTYDTACEACNKAKQELKDYKKEHKL